jgi:hypothetical protein
MSDGISETQRTRYINFIKRNGETLWKEGTNKQEVLFGPDWKTKPGATTGLTGHTSGCMLMEALAWLQKEERL